MPKWLDDTTQSKAKAITSISIIAILGLVVSSFMLAGSLEVLLVVLTRFSLAKLEQFIVIGKFLLLGFSISVKISNFVFL
jgi:hypothetical protein